MTNLFCVTWWLSGPVSIVKKVLSSHWINSGYFNLLLCICWVSGLLVVCPLRLEIGYQFFVSPLGQVKLAQDLHILKYSLSAGYFLILQKF